MCCRNFFRFTLICSAFQFLFGSSVMANEVALDAISSSNIETSNNQSVENKETNDSTSNKNGESTVEISILLEKEQPVKGIKVQISLEPENNDSSAVADGYVEQILKSKVQAGKDKIISLLDGIIKDTKEVLKNNYSDEQIGSLLNNVESWELRAQLVRDNDHNNWQLNLASPTTVQNMNLLEKTPLDENNFVEINLINK